MPRRAPSFLPIALGGIAGVLAAGLCVVGAQRLAAPEPAPPRAGPPNLLLITLCSWRVDHMGAYGGAPGVTPTFDALAAEGALFTHAWSNAAYTSVAHAALLTGRLPEHNGLVDVVDSLPAEVPVLPEILRLYGYHTLAWTTVASPVSFRRGDSLDRGFDQFIEPAAGALAPLSPPADPWFTLAHIKDAHVPYYAGARDEDEADPLLHAWLERTRTGQPPGEPPDRWLAGQLADAPDTRARLRARYDRALSAADARLAAVLARVAEQRDHTVIVVVGDHGEALGESGHMGHGELLPEIVQVPLLIVAPGLSPTHIPDDVSLVDLFPTLLATAGAGVPAGVDGRDLTARLSGAALPPRPAVAQALTRPVGAPERIGADAFAQGDAWVRCPRDAACAALSRASTGWIPAAVESPLVEAGRALLVGAAPQVDGRAPTAAERADMQRAGYFTAP